jgi:hypothetical protein
LATSDPTIPEAINNKTFQYEERYRDWFFATEPPTPYEHPMYYPVLTQIVTSIAEGAARWKMQNIIPPTLLFGTLPTGSINASATPVPDSDDNLVLFDFGLFQFTGEMAKILARLIPAKSTFRELRFNMGAAQEPQYAVDRQPDLIAHFGEVLYGYLVEGNPRRMPTIPLGGRDQHLLAGGLMDSSRSFVLGHELGHLISRHLSARTALRRLIGQLNTVEIYRSWEDEFEADHWGFNYEQTRRLSLEWALVGSTLFFSCIGAVERCLIALSYGRLDLENRGSQTHPPAGERLSRLQGIVEERCDPKDAREILEWSNYIDALMYALAERVCPSFRQLHLNGIRPAAQWQST